MSDIVTTASLRGRLSRWLALQTMLGLGLVCVVVYVLFALTVSERQDEALSQKQNTVEHLLAGGELEHGGFCEGGSVRCGAQALTVAGLDEEGGARGR